MFKLKKIDAPFAINTSPMKKRNCYTFKNLFRTIVRNPQQVYFESRGKCVKQLLRYNGYPNKVFLYPEEGWARNASSSYILIKMCSWWPNLCIIEEKAGTKRKKSTYARMVCTEPGSLTITGSFKKQSVDPDFKLSLTSNVSTSDYNMGYCLTGTLERGYKSSNKFQQTHFVVVRRRWPATKHAKST